LSPGLTLWFAVGPVVSEEDTCWLDLKTALLVTELFVPEVAEVLRPPVGAIGIN
jgi:hypothetical protein